MKQIGIFGCGDIGIRLGEQLRHDHRVFGVRRDANKIPSTIEALSLDLSKPFTPDALPSQPQIAYVILTPDARNDAAYETTYVNGLKHLLTALENTPLERLIFVSSTAVYGQDGGEWLDETAETQPQGFNGKRLLEAERLLANAPYPTTCVRFGGIYGPGRNRLVRKIQQGEASYLHHPPSYTNRIHIEDCVGFLAHLALVDEVHPVYNGCDNLSATQLQVYTYIAQLLNVAPPKQKENIERSEGKRCCNQRLRDSGYRLKYPSFIEGYHYLCSQT